VNIYFNSPPKNNSDGTTDVTRTLHFTGKASPEEKDAYTRVLLGNLDIQKLVWPARNKISGADIDVLARRHLWQVCL
jgi:Xaa-Pro aminopeptidase